jgi:hypothetical protein
MIFGLSERIQPIILGNTRVYQGIRYFSQYVIDLEDAQNEHAYSRKSLTFNGCTQPSRSMTTYYCKVNVLNLTMHLCVTQKAQCVQRKQCQVCLILGKCYIFHN